jgi:predicted outer membrane protein
MRITRNAGTLFVTGALTLTLAALAYPAMLGVQTTSAAPVRIIANPSSGPLTEADRDFVVKVRAAGLWEYPVGQLALEKGTIPAVRTAGEHLISGHAGLDDTSRKIAKQLGITLPNKPSPQQQGFVATLTADSGTKFDTDFANILRITHGQIFSTVAKIRASTENTLVRQLADQANDTVLDHISVMEKTGLVDFEQVIIQETTLPKMPKENLTPPPPPVGEPTLVLPAPPGSGSVSAKPSPTPTVG